MGFLDKFGIKISRENNEKNIKTEKEKTLNQKNQVGKYIKKCEECGDWLTLSSSKKHPKWCLEKRINKAREEYIRKGICHNCKKDIRWFKRDFKPTSDGLCAFCKADNMLYEVGIIFEEDFENQEKGVLHISCKQLEDIFPKKTKNIGEVNQIVDIDFYLSLIHELVNHDFTNLNKIVNSICEKIALDYEKEKIKQRQKKLEIKNKAEKEYFGKTKTKRIKLTTEEEASIFDKFNHECALCSAQEGLHIHYKNKNPVDNRVENLILLCGVCHKKVHMTVR